VRHRFHGGVPALGFMAQMIEVGAFRQPVSGKSAEILRCGHGIPSFHAPGIRKAGWKSGWTQQQNDEWAWPFTRTMCLSVGEAS
jgi:hypothetical protein